MTSYNKHNPESIQSLFNTIAEDYDRTNTALSFSLDRSWNRELVKKVLIPDKSHQFLDLCSGTGNVAFEYLKRSKSPCQAYLIDFSSEMLACAKRKIESHPLDKHHIKFIQADVQRLPITEESIDCATLAYGIRNVDQPLDCIKEVFRVLKPGGQFAILELTRPNNSLLRIGHQLYLKTLLPVIGKWLTSNEEAYQYLQNSIRTFIPPEQLCQMLTITGFSSVRSQSLMGGIATIISGIR